MAATDPGISQDFWEANHAWITAIVSVAVAFAIASLVDRAFSRRGSEVAQTVLRDGLSRGTATRLRFVRRLIYAVIVLIGVAIALSQFAGISRLANSLLASGAIAAAIVGFAARQTLANVVAGVMLAITQPVRVGDWVTIEDNYGVVEDVRLNYTILRTLGDQRIVVPNERLAGGIMRNDTLTRDAIGLDVAIWLPPDADTDRAIEVLEEETGQSVSIAEALPWGVRLSVGGAPVPPPDKSAHEAELRARCLRRLRQAGLLTGGSPQRF